MRRRSSSSRLRSEIVESATAARLLIVEDDSALSSALQDALRNAGFDVRSVSSGEGALKALTDEHWDCMVLDIGLPGIDGFEVLRRLKDQASSVHVLVLTARDLLEDRMRGLSLGADDYMTKPFPIAELIGRVQALVQEGHGHSAAVMINGPLTLNLDAQRAFLNGKPLELPLREWDILKVFLSNKNKVLSDAKIARSIAIGACQELSGSAVATYVSRLRVKLIPAGIQIRNVRGFGYMMLSCDPQISDPTHGRAP